MSTKQLMLKRLNFIQTSLETFDPAKMKREYRKRIEQTREERIYELWKTDIRQRRVQDIAMKLDAQTTANS